MGNYNPHVPQILGEEWVPIREEEITFSPTVNAYERGHTFELTTPRIVADGRFYVAEPIPGRVQYQFIGMSVYPEAGAELSGPVKKVVIPVSGGAVTGANFTIIGAANLRDALFSPGDGHIFFNYDANSRRANIFFDTSSYPDLNGKRILDVSFLYSAIGEDMPGFGLPPPTTGTPTTLVSLQIVNGVSQSYTYLTGPLSVNGFSPSVFQLNRISLGEIQPFNNGAVAFGFNTLPWTYSDLLRLDSGNMCIQLLVQTFDASGIQYLDAQMELFYVALEVTYCEETRIATACQIRDSNSGVNVMPMFHPVTLAANPTLPVGGNLVTVSAPNAGDFNSAIQQGAQYPFLNCLRELYTIPSHQGRQLNLTTTEGETITIENSAVIPQLSLHISGATLPPFTEVHAYGRQAVAEVYGSNSATQHIHDNPVGGTAQFPQVRYYARRFGETVVPLVFSSPDITGFSCVVTPAEYDALDEILDGWKEINCRLQAPGPTMGGFAGSPRWQWVAAGELPGNRWEILGASAPAVSGQPINVWNLAPSTQRLDTATYQPGAGATSLLNWIPQGVASPPVTGSSDDPASDAVLIFSQDPPAVTGLSVTQLTQALSGFGDCQPIACCIPTALTYNHITWGPPASGSAMLDTFSRVVSDGWGTSDTGQVWVAEGSPISGFGVDGSRGWHDAIMSAATKRTLVPGPVDGEATFTVSTPVISSGEAAQASLLVREDGANTNFYVFRLLFFPSSELELRISARIAGVENTIGNTVGTQGTYSPNVPIRCRCRWESSTFEMKAWVDGDPEPDDWMVTAVDTTLTAAGRVGFRSALGTVFTNWTGPVPLRISYDNFSMINIDSGFGSYELQRMDELTDWQTIMSTSSPVVLSFEDYEARIGITSWYQIRQLNVLDFAGAWSPAVSGMISEPGITMSCGPAGHILVFTTNERQDGSSNLAYSSVWESGRVEEGFVFPEAGFVQLQAMYNRDFFTAFRPSERGGERFDRTLLVNAAAISPETLGDFTNLRDMAWDSVSYICVRDEDGNRWFATVLVPGGRVLRDRRLYLAPVTVVEVTDTASPANVPAP